MKVAIIGSGISSLYLAYILKQKGYYIDIYEKNNYIGGRVKMVKFENKDVVAGAGILRLNKDKLVYNFFRKLNVEMKQYKNLFSYSFDPVNIMEIIEILKKNLKIFIDEGKRSEYTFKKYASNILGNKLYNEFVKSCGLSDFEKADVIDTIYNYGFDDCISGYIAVSVKWQQVLDNLYLILKNDIHLNTPIKKIREIEDNKYIIKNQIYDKVVISTNIDIIREFFLKNKIYRNIEGQSFVRLYVKLNKPIENYDKVIITDAPFQKIIEMDKQNCIYMISYSDNKIANKWKKDKNIKKTVKNGILKIFKLDVKVLKHKLIYWKIGTHYFKPLLKEFKDRNEFLKVAQNPKENLFVIGEAFSNEQGWVEGALESVEQIINKI